MSAIGRCARLSRVLIPLRSAGRGSNALQKLNQRKTILSTRPTILLPSSCSGVRSRPYSSDSSQTDTNNAEHKQPDSSTKLPISRYWQKLDVENNKNALKDLSMLNLEGHFGPNSFIGIKKFYTLIRIADKAEKVSMEEACFIVRLLGNLGRMVDMETRMNLYTHFDNKFNSIGIEKTSAYYNAVLRMYLDNKQDFNVTDFLQQMSEEGCTPDTGTLALCLTHYCDKGEMQSSSVLLEHMNAAGMTINALVYSKIILGHYRQGNAEIAKGLYEDAESLGFENKALCFDHLAMGLMLVDDEREFHKIFEEAELSQLEIRPLQMQRLLDFAAENKKDNYTDFLLARIPVSDSPRHASSCFLSLIQNGYVEKAYSYLKTLNCQGAPLAELLNLDSLSLDDKVSFLRRLKEDGLIEQPFTAYIFKAMADFRFEEVLELLPYIKSENESPRHLLVPPLLSYLEKCEDLAGVKRVFVDVPALRGYLAMSDIVFKMTNRDLHEYRMFLKDLGVFSEDELNWCEIFQTWHLKGVKVAGEAATTLPCRQPECVPYALKNSLIDHLTKHPEDWAAVLSLESRLERYYINLKDVLKAIIPNLKNDQEQLVELTKLCQRLGTVRLLDECFEDEGLAKIEVAKEPGLGSRFIDYKQHSLEELMARENENKQKPSFYLSVLLKAKNNQEMQKFAMENLERLKDRISVKNALPNKFLLSHYAQSADNAEKMHQLLLDILKSKMNNLYLNTSSAVEHVIYHLWRTGRYSDAVEVLSLEQAWKQLPVEETSDRAVSLKFISHKQFSMLKFFTRMENTKENAETACKMLDGLVEGRHFNFNSNLLVDFWNFIIQSNCGDVECVKDGWQLIKKAHKSDWPQSRRLPVELQQYARNPEPKKEFDANFQYDLTGAFVPFISDVKMVSSLFDMFRDSYDGNHVVLSFGAAFLENEDSEKFVKVLNKMDVPLYRKHVKTITNRWEAQGKYHLAKEFLKHARNLKGTFRYSLYHLHFMGMCAQPDPNVEDCMRFFDQHLGFESDNISLSINELRDYASFLRKHEQPVPFANMLECSHNDFKQEVLRIMTAKNSGEDQNIGVDKLLNVLKHRT